MPPWGAARWSGRAARSRVDGGRGSAVPPPTGGLIAGRASSPPSHRPRGGQAGSIFAASSASASVSILASRV
jgi:hypothetical protein